MNQQEYLAKIYQQVDESAKKLCINAEKHGNHTSESFLKVLGVLSEISSLTHREITTPAEQPTITCAVVKNLSILLRIMSHYVIHSPFELQQKTIFLDEINTIGLLLNTLPETKDVFSTPEAQTSITKPIEFNDPRYQTVHSCAPLASESATAGALSYNVSGPKSEEYQKQCCVAANRISSLYLSPQERDTRVREEQAQALSTLHRQIILLTQTLPTEHATDSVQQPELKLKELEKEIIQSAGHLNKLADDILEQNRYQRTDDQRAVESAILELAEILFLVKREQNQPKKEYSAKMIAPNVHTLLHYLTQKALHSAAKTVADKIVNELDDIGQHLGGLCDSHTEYTPDKRRLPISSPIEYQDTRLKVTYRIKPAENVHTENSTSTQQLTKNIIAEKSSDADVAAYEKGINAEHPNVKYAGIGLSDKETKTATRIELLTMLGLFQRTCLGGAEPESASDDSSPSSSPRQ